MKLPKKDALLYKTCESVASYFKDSLFADKFDFTISGRLTRKMVQEMRREIDHEILNDLRIASGLSSIVPPISIMTLTPPKKDPTPRKLKASWSMESTDQLRATSTLKSRLINR
jgi:hypothetical protein